MKVIDEKGRLFEKINIIDFLVILFLLSLTPMFYFANKIYTNEKQQVKEQAQPQEQKDENTSWINAQVKFSGIIPEVEGVIKEGDEEKDYNGKLIGKLSKLIANKHSAVLAIENARFISLPHPLQRDIIAEFDFLTIKKNNTLFYKNYSVKIGNPIEFSTDLYSITGTIIKVKK